MGVAIYLREGTPLAKATISDQFRLRCGSFDYLKTTKKTRAARDLLPTKEENHVRRINRRLVSQHQSATLFPPVKQSFPLYVTPGSVQTITDAVVHHIKGEGGIAFHPEDDRRN